MEEESESDLFSFSVLDDKKVTVVAWRLSDVQATTTFTQVSRINDSVLQKYDLSKTECVLGKSPITADDQSLQCPCLDPKTNLKKREKYSQIMPFRRYDVTPLYAFFF